MRALIFAVAMIAAAPGMASELCKRIAAHNLAAAHVDWIIPPFACARELGILADKVYKEEEVPPGWICGNGLFYDHDGKLGFLCHN